MEIKTSQVEATTVLSIIGEIDLHASPKLRESLREVAKNQPARVAADFSNVEYIDSSGLATLIEFVRDNGSSGARLVLFGLKPKVRMVFELVRLNELFTICDSQAEAITALASA